MVLKTSVSRTVLFGPHTKTRHSSPSSLRVCAEVIVSPVNFFIRLPTLTPQPVHYYQHGRNGDFALQAPMVLGHESAGIVTAVGPGVKHLVPGQRVAIEAGIMCGHCRWCKGGRYNLCKSMRFCSSASTFPHQDGTLQDCMNHPAHLLHPYVHRRYLPPRVCPHATHLRILDYRTIALSSKRLSQSRSPSSFTPLEERNFVQVTLYLFSVSVPLAFWHAHSQSHKARLESRPSTSTKRVSTSPEHMDSLRIHSVFHQRIKPRRPTNISVVQRRSSRKR
jgi:hypothetical protein